MKKTCYITINGMHANAVSESEFSDRFDHKYEELVEFAKNEFDFRDGKVTSELVQHILDEFSPEKKTLPETVFTTYGILECDGEWTNVSFQNGIESMDPDEMTSFVVHPDKKTVSLIRRGQNQKSMTFQNCKSLVLDYNPELKSTVTLFSRNVDVNINENGGNINLDYFIELHGNICEHNKFSINIRT